tara:strand:+ start:332 stop:616 length:285 start_codon:yes stop_codon:yes gene_type:complete
VSAHIYIIYPCHILSILARVFNQTGVGVVFTFENCRKTALVVEKNTRVLHSTKKTPRAGASGVGCLCLCKKDVRSIIAVVVQSYLARAAQVYIE